MAGTHRVDPESNGRPTVKAAALPADENIKKAYL
jgi:hypothetical protein